MSEGITISTLTEGLDAISVNQIIMLRPTESPIIFIQQLGRGLRKCDGKEYVVVLDFIGNYTNNFMIPIALSGDRTYNKDNIRRYVREGARIIPGASTIHFDEISRKRIFESIDKANTSEARLLRDSYIQLKNKLGRIPTIAEFDEYGYIDVTKIFDKFGSYHNFLVKYERDYNMELSKDEALIIEFLSTKLAKGKRVQELLVLRSLLQQRDRVINYYELLNGFNVGRELPGNASGDTYTNNDSNTRINAAVKAQGDLNKNHEGLRGSELERLSVYNVLTNRFPLNKDIKKYGICTFITDTPSGFMINPVFSRMLENVTFARKVSEIIDFGIKRYERDYEGAYKDTNMKLYRKYTYEDVCRLLNWERNMTALNIGGYFYDKKTKTLPVFINYDKADDAIAYHDRFVTESELVALSKHPRDITSSDADHFYKRKPEDADNRIFLFVRKNKDDKEAKEFYFLGEIEACGEPRPITMEGTNDHAFEIDYRLDVPVREDIYDYITK